MFSTWRLKDFDIGGGIDALAFADNVKQVGWIDVEVPGDVYLALVAAGRLPHPFQDRNESLAAWVERREWWYRCEFDSPCPGDHERLKLILHGLDTFATIWLNGVRLGESQNMFRAATFDIGAFLRTGKPNTLAICFEPVSARLAERTALSWPIGGVAPISETKRNLVRKAQFGWGWDWGPYLPTVGIWRPVELRLERRAALDTVHFATTEIDAARDEAHVTLDAEISCVDIDAHPQLRVTLLDASGKSVLSEILQFPADSERRTIKIERTIQNPQLWWTHDLGLPHLYSLHVELIENGVVLDTREEKVGIRTISLDQSPDADEPGTRFFRFVLNGVPIFSKGACWIPASSFVGALTEERYRSLLEAAVDTNMNMIRIWGGGVYEHDSFYELCDRLGLLVWQDFMFACAPYPENDPDFVENVREEVRYQIARLRNRPSLALWCGNNENQVIQQAVNAITRTSEKLAGDLYYDRMMPEIVGELDPTTPYWPGSPFGGGIANDMNQGDVHDWTVWHGMPGVVDGKFRGGLDRTPEGVAYTRYAEDSGRFISEFGIQASSALETLRCCMAADELFLGSAALDHRIKDHPKNKVDMMMTTVTGLPQSLPDYIDYTMMTQAEGLKFGIEHFRRRKPHCSGTLIWQLNDCWPGISWSIVDYNGFGKAGYYYTKRAYAPVLASFKTLEDGSVELWITNDTLADIADTATIELGNFATGTVWTEDCAYRASANGSAPVWRASAARLRPAPDLYLRTRSSADLFPVNRNFFAPIKDLVRPANGKPDIAIVPVGPHELSVEIGTFSYLYFVHLLTPDGRTHFDENYFDLAAGERRRFSVFNNEAVLNADDIKIAWR
ncbi:MAG: hypothetical protein K8R18_13760 [Parvibaculum sp.]|uniref:beta-mannosidase n=1 Tax=Parvibaculum sp. TaxID=2024848 RepID=UPI0025EB2CEA|nr:hypothetical protein [Parvibaculum sp.]MCE9650681.1 hypothetical protein [Parvibaculum sp.]